MFERQEISGLDDFFTDLSDRAKKGVYFYRICAWNEEVGLFIRKYYKAARRLGVVIEGKIPNPDGNNLSYYNEIMGPDFQLAPGFLDLALKKWLPRMNSVQRKNVADSMYDMLDALRKSGKNINMLKNAYIKFMCWLYYKFGQVADRFGEDQLPKILYEGETGTYERMLLSILSCAGCDVVLLQYGGGGAQSVPERGGLQTAQTVPGRAGLQTAQTAPERGGLQSAQTVPGRAGLQMAQTVPGRAGLQMAQSATERGGLQSASVLRGGAPTASEEVIPQPYELRLPGMGPFPPSFCLRWLRTQMEEEENRARLYGKEAGVANCTNAWMSGDIFADICKSAESRGADRRFFYNCFCRMNGVEDKLTYVNDLYKLNLELRKDKRKVVVVNGAVPPPSNEEIAQIRRKSYKELEPMLADLSANIQYPANSDLQRLATKAFLDVMLEETKRLSGRLPDGQGIPSAQRAQNPKNAQPPGREADVRPPGALEVPLNRMMNQAVSLLCWQRRYGQALFAGWKMPTTACFIHMGGCRKRTEALFLKFLARLPVDVLILNPDLNNQCCLEDQLLYEKNYACSLEVLRFPEEHTEVKMGTAAYHAERELDTVLYGDSGLYRTRQFKKANAITLQTMYEEIGILWKEELKYRPNFSITEDTVNMPVIFAKISGVKDGQTKQYWQSVRELAGEDAFVIPDVPFFGRVEPNPPKEYAVRFLNGKNLRRADIKRHPHYLYSFLREEMQEHMLDKLQEMLDQKLIKGTFENGMEYTVIATALNLPKEIVRKVQSFDFTKKNPKLILINTREKAISLEDSIMISFLNLIGFDIVIFVPTGYRCVEKYFNKTLMEEHQIGEYMYDMEVPDLAAAGPATQHGFLRGRIFKRT